MPLLAGLAVAAAILLLTPTRQMARPSAAVQSQERTDGIASRPQPKLGSYAVVAARLPKGANAFGDYRRSGCWASRVSGAHATAATPASACSELSSATFGLCS
jgi:hypothetical protein